MKKTTLIAALALLICAYSATALKQNAYAGQIGSYTSQTQKQAKHTYSQIGGSSIDVYNIDYKNTTRKNNNTDEYKQFQKQMLEQKKQRIFESQLENNVK